MSDGIYCDTREFESISHKLGRNSPAYPKFKSRSHRSHGKTLEWHARTAAGTVLKNITYYAPVRTGTLKSGLILNRERSRDRAKIVFDVMPDPKMNSVFRKPIENPVFSATPYGYYPASQEYGYFTRRSDGGMEYKSIHGNTVKMDKVPGKYYMRGGAEISRKAVEDQIIKGSLDTVIEMLGG